MQSKGAIKFFAIVFALVCLYQLSFSFFTSRVESKAKNYANSNEVKLLAKQLSIGNTSREQIIFDSLSKAKERFYLDSMQNKVVFNVLIRKYTYKECKQREINLGLDLKGGMNVTLEVSVPEIVRALSGNSKDITFNKAMALALEKQKNSQKDFVTLFGESFKEVDPNAQLIAIFGFSMKTKVADLEKTLNRKPNNEEILKMIADESNDAIDRTYNILKTRIDRFGVTQPNIQKLSTAGRILVELPGIKEPERVRKLLQGSAKLEFWETYEFKEIYPYLAQVDKVLKNRFYAIDTLTAKDTINTTITKADTSKSSSLIDKATNKANKPDSTSLKNNKGNNAKEHPLFAYLELSLSKDQAGNIIPLSGPVLGLCEIRDTSLVNKMLSQAYVKALLPRDLKLAWSIKPEKEGTTSLNLVALRYPKNSDQPKLTGEVITDARQDFDQNGNVEISMRMNNTGARIWKDMTALAAPSKRCIAIVLDNFVYSNPRVQGEIPNGSSQISGQFSLTEGKDLANVLKSGKLPATARIVQEEVVGPTLGKEAINAGLWSFIVAFILTLLYMIFYYNRAGMVANVALFVNMFFVFGILASLGAVLTLPGIAGIVLTLGMDVDKNVIIYERIREEIRVGKGIRLAIDDGYKHAMSAIIDSNITTLLTAIVLFIFGSGPIQGFATTLIIGIISSMFCAIFISRLVFIWMMDKNIEINVWNKLTKNVLTKVNFNFIGLRKIYYVISLSVIVIGIISLSTRGLSYGIDFLGGRSYVVRFDRDVKTDEVRTALAKVYGTEPEVKTFGPSNQVKITTSFMIQNKSNETDSIVETKLYQGLKPIYTKEISQDDFLGHSETKVLGRLSSQKIEPTIAYSLLVNSYFAVLFSLIIIFIYIAIRFKKWQWGMGGVIALFHDTFITIGIFSLFYGILPFSLDVDQHFIAAILTIIGYSIMDSVIIFDRIREYTTLYPKKDLKTNMNDAINSTLGRTLNTSGVTFMVLLAMFIFGGEVIRGFAFALLIGVAVGTYSSVFTASPIAYDLIMMKERRKAKKEAALNPKKK
ncbi:MAG: protein translocase subunit SecDF [Bacteroidetes bacterium CG2_30_32_10]|nr:MAG: protein translocase subunit SecDF [Bacteroidetes bacterium CG2_30_32_10]